MKILVLSNKPPIPPKDGGSISTYGIAKALADLGHKVSIIAMNTSKHRIKLENYQIPLNISIKYINVNIGINPLMVFYNFLFSSFPYNAERFISKKFKKEVEYTLNCESFDVIQIEGPYLSYLLPLMRKMSDAIIVHRAHNIEHEIWERTAQISKNIFKKFYLMNLAKRLKKFELSLFTKYDVWHPNTQRDGEIYKKLGCNIPGIILPTGVDLSSLTFKPEMTHYPSLCYIGALDWIPNQEGLLWFIDKVWPMLSEKFPELKFNIAGRNAPTWLVSKLKLDNIIFHGEVDDAYTFLNQYAVQTVPILSGSGMRVKIVEGMALGKAIVTSTAGAEGVDVTPAENILIGDNPYDFMLQLSRLLEDKKLFISISTNARKFALDSYDNLKIARLLSDFYQQQLNSL
jgi:glycosyltransferase involved in cell wall biosynthesis